MRISFTTNDYLLTWNILFGASISLEGHQFKQKLWTTYKNQYHAIENDKEELLRDYRNFIPDDDTIYNLLFETELFENVKKSAKKNKNIIMQVYDHNKKKIDKYLNETIRMETDNNYNVLVMDPNMDVVLKSDGAKTFGWGKKEDAIDTNRTVCKIIKEIISSIVGQVEQEYRVIKEAILELAIENELCTRLSGKSRYDEGNKVISQLKKQIYPYWLMYLGVKPDDLMSYMMRDKIAFELDKYTYEKELKKINLKDFINFCIRNKKTILRFYPQLAKKQGEVKQTQTEVKQKKEIEATTKIEDIASSINKTLSSAYKQKGEVDIPKNASRVEKVKKEEKLIINDDIEVDGNRTNLVKPYQNTSSSYFKQQAPSIYKSKKQTEYVIEEKDDTFLLDDDSPLLDQQLEII